MRPHNTSTCFAKGKQYDDQPDTGGLHSLNGSYPPRALVGLPEIKAMLGIRPPVFFLDFDGTLAPIVERPEMAEMPANTRESLRALAEAHPVCVVSGRPLDFLRAKVGLDTVFYAADHGHRIVGPAGSSVDFEIVPGRRSRTRSSGLRSGRGAAAMSKACSWSPKRYHWPSTTDEWQKKTVRRCRGSSQISCETPQGSGFWKARWSTN